MTARKSTTDEVKAPSDAVGAVSGDTASAHSLHGLADAYAAHARIADGEAKTATHDYEEALDKGYLGVSPAREITGKDDKGLTLPSVTAGE
jgi:hypothetical protein